MSPHHLVASRAVMVCVNQPTICRVIGCLALLLVSGCSPGTGRSSGRAFEFRYAVSLPSLPTQASQVRVWIPLAKTRENQRILARRIQTNQPYEIREEPVFGNDILYLALRRPIPESLDITVDYDVQVRGGRRLGPGLSFPSESVASADELAVALRDEPLMVVNDTITRWAREATAGRTDELEKARAIYEHVIAHMSYDKVAPGWGRGDTMRACRLGKGNCTDFHSLFISMARASGIPSRFVIGAVIPREPHGTIPGYHCWAEFYHPTHGWIPVDASEAWKHPERRDDYFGALDPDKLLLSEGRNLRLVPAQAGPPVNIFFYPYVEVDGMSSGHVVVTRFEFTNRHNKGGAT